VLGKRERHEVGRRARPRIPHRAPVQVLHGLHRAVRLRVPEQIGRAGHLGADDLHRRALGGGADDAEDAVGHREVGAVGDDRLQRLGAAARPGDLDLDARVPEDAGFHAGGNEVRVPQAALADRRADLFLGGGGNGDQGRANPGY
jgi:hypothetical protein